MISVRDLLAAQGLFANMEARDLDTLAGCARNAHFSTGEHLVREGAAADTFHLVRHGRVGVEIHVPGRGARVLGTRHEGEVVGWSWLFPPYRWRHDVRAMEDVRTLAFDGRCLRDKAEADHRLGYELMRRFAAIAIRELDETRVQLLDVYGHEHAR